MQISFSVRRTQAENLYYESEYDKHFHRMKSIENEQNREVIKELIEKISMSSFSLFSREESCHFNVYVSIKLALIQFMLFATLTKIVYSELLIRIFQTWNGFQCILWQ